MNRKAVCLFAFSILFLILVWLFFIATASRQNPRYRIESLGLVDERGGESWWDMNESGWLCGTEVDPQGKPYGVLINPNRERIDLGSVAALSINESNEIVCYASGESFIRSPSGTFTALVHPEGSLQGPFHLNDNGEVAGIYFPSGSKSGKAFIRSATGTITLLGTLGGHHSQPRSINNFSEVAGISMTATGTRDQGFLWSEREGMVAFEEIIDRSTHRCDAINDRGHVVGTLSEMPGGPRAFLWSKEGGLTVLGHLGGRMSQPRDINDLDQVVGYSETEPVLDLEGWMERALDRVGLGGLKDRLASRPHAFLWQDGTMEDLNDLIPPASGWELIEARKINDHGRIIGWGISGGEACAFLMTPTEEPEADLD